MLGGCFFSLKVVEQFGGAIISVLHKRRYTYKKPPLHYELTLGKDYLKNNENKKSRIPVVQGSTFGKKFMRNTLKYV